MFAVRQKYKSERNDLMQNLVKLNMNSLYGAQLRKDNNEPYKCVSEHWMQTVYEDNVIDYWKLAKGKKTKKDSGLDGDNAVNNTLPSHLGAFILSNSKRIINKFIGETNGFSTNNVYYTDTGSL